MRAYQKILWPCRLGEGYVVHLHPEKYLTFLLAYVRDILVSPGGSHTVLTILNNLKVFSSFLKISAVQCTNLCILQSGRIILQM